MAPVWWVLFGGMVTIMVVEGVFIVAILRALGHLDQQVDAMSGGQSAASAAHGSNLADATFQGLDGHVFSLSDLWRQGKLALFFVASGCSSCVELLSHLGQLEDVAAQSGVRCCVLCLGQPSSAQRLAAAAGLSSEVAVAAIEHRHGFKDFGISTTPTLITVDFTGRVDRLVTGPLDRGRLEEIIFAGMTTSFVA